MRRVALILTVYGVFLLLAGLAGYLSNPERAKTALLSGGLFGTLSIGLGWLARGGWARARAVGLGLAAFLGTVFVWRSVVTWMAVAGGAGEKTTAAWLISAMLVGTVVLAMALLRRPGALESSGRVVS